jgi:hypothetical protein
MIYKRVEGVVWNAQGKGRVRTAEEPVAPLSAEAFRLLAGIVSREEFNRIYKEWERGERQIRADAGFIMMTFTPATDAPSCLPGHA